MNLNTFCFSNPLKEFFIEIWNYEYNGISNYPEIEKFCRISKIPSQMFSKTKRNLNGMPMRLFDFIFPEYQSNFHTENFSQTSDFFENNIEEPDLSELENNDEAELSELASIPLKSSEKEKTAWRYIKTSQNLLSLYSFEDEYFSLENNDSNSILTFSCKKNAVRRYFDSKMRLERKEIWNIDGIKNSSIIRCEKYNYDEDNKLISMEAEEKDGKNILEYDKEGHIVYLGNYSFFLPDKIDKDNDKIQEKKLLLNNFSSWQYNAGGKVIEKYCENYLYKQGIIVETQTSTELYDYKQEDKNPDYYYYENGELKMRTVYTEDNSYITSIFFDNGSIIKSFYTDGKKVKDIYYLNGKILRRHIYE